MCKYVNKRDKDLGTNMNTFSRQELHSFFVGNRHGFLGHLVHMVFQQSLPQLHLIKLPMNHAFGRVLAQSSNQN
jgi:hypothetical protein